MDNQEPKSDEQIVAECNELARAFFSMLGYQVRDGFKFYPSHRNGRVRLAWQMAVKAYEFIEKTPVEDCISNLGLCDDENEQLKREADYVL